MSFEDITTTTLAERLVAARKSAKVTQESAAECLGISRPTFIAIEKGSRRLRPAELVKLLELYKLPLNKFLREEKSKYEIRPHLRSILEYSDEGQEGLASAIEKLSDFIEDYRYIEGLINIRMATAFPPAARVQGKSIEKFAEHCAQDERTRLNLGAYLPVYTPRKVLEEAGIHVFIDRLDSKLAGLYSFVPDFGYCILVNKAHPKERRRWTIAHEYGHFIIDRDKPGVDYLKPMARKPENERFADAFAAAFLMPEAGVQKKFWEEVNRTGDFKVSDMCLMADYFKVSLMAMTLRLESIGLIPRGSWDDIKESGVAISALNNEAGIEKSHDHDSISIFPHRYKMLAVKAFQEEKISEGQLANLLRCNRLEARDIVEQCALSVDSSDGPSSIRLSLMQSLLPSSSR